MHTYKVDKTSPSRLKVGRPIIILYEKEASITRCLTFIFLALFSSPKVIFKVVYPITCTCSLENLTSDPLKGLRSFWLRWILSNASQYIMSVEIPWSTRTILISQYSHLTMMTMWLSLWGLMAPASFSETTIVASGVWISSSTLTLGRFSTLRI